jgi:hypothetical protein
MVALFQQIRATRHDRGDHSDHALTLCMRRSLVLSLSVVLASIAACSKPDDATTASARPVAAAPARHLRVSGTHFLTADGSIFSWRGITAFRLIDYVADKQEDRAVEYLAWARRQGLTVVRVLAMAGGFIELKPEEGRAALARLLELAAEHDIYVEVVALAGTADIPVDLQQHVAEIGRIVAAHPNALLEIANEPVHPTQSAEVHQPAVLAKLAAGVPDAVPIALGSIERGDGFGAGDYITWHAPRDNRHDGWGHVLAVAEGADLIAKWRKPVISDEPIGAGPEYIAGRRDNQPARFRAAALLTRLTGAGATFHYEGGLQAAIPQGVELQCFNAWNAAWTLLPSAVEDAGEFAVARSPQAQVLKDLPSAALGGWERVVANRAWVLVVGNSVGSITLAPGWQADGIQESEGMWLVSARRAR